MNWLPSTSLYVVIFCRYTAGFDELKKMVANWTPARMEKLAGIPVDQLRAAAQLLETTQTLVSSELQSIYQSRPATAAAVQVNNRHLIWG